MKAEAQLKGKTEMRLGPASMCLAVQMYFDALFEKGRSPIVTDVRQHDNDFIIKTDERTP